MSLPRVELVIVSPNGQLFTVAVGQPTSGGAVPLLTALQLPSVLNQAGATPNQITAVTDAIDAVQVVGESPENGFAGMLVVSRGTVFNGATWDRAREVAGDGQAATGIPVAHCSLWNGASYDRSYAASAANLGAESSKGALITTPPGNWTLTNTPAGGSQATATRAGVAGVRHVLNSIFACVTLTTTPAASNFFQDFLVVRDGASGVGTILWQAVLGSFVNITSHTLWLPYVQLSGLNIVGTAGNAMTVEFTAAPLAAQYNQNLSATGYDAS